MEVVGVGDSPLLPSKNEKLGMVLYLYLVDKLVKGKFAGLPIIYRVLSYSIRYLLELADIDYVNRCCQE